MIRWFSLILIMVMTSCVSTRPIPVDGLDFTLDRCTPFLNCVSSESTIGLYRIDSIELVSEVDRASWQQIKEAALALPGAKLRQERFGYLDIVCLSNTVGFPDYFEVLLDLTKQSLAVRSQSLFGLYDMGVNRKRVQRFKAKLLDLGLAR